jgi:hypothetical protein
MLGFSADPPPRPIAEVLLQMAGNGLLPRAGRKEALSVPAVLGGRNLICSPATLPLIQRDRNFRIERLSLLEQIDPDVPNVVTLSQTIEDLLFEGISWWKILSFGADDYPTKAQHVDFANVSLQPPGAPSPSPLPSGQDPRDAVVYMYGEPIPAERVIRFDSPNPGLLTAAGRIIRRAVLLDTTSALYADNPRPLDYFTPTDPVDPATDQEVKDILNDWLLARKQRATAYVPAALKYNSVDTPTPAELQLVELQNKATRDLANAMGLDPEDLGISTTSRTYQNGVDRRQDRINDTFSPYMAAITHRLSMPDVTKRGRVVAFDLDEYLRADPLTRATVYEKAGVGPWLTPDEARAEEGRPALTAVQRAEMMPAAAAADPVPDNVVPIRRAMAADPQELIFDLDTMPLATVDRERRIIEGIGVPYGPDKIAWKGGYRYRFQLGSLVPPREMQRNKMLRDHDNAQPQGKLAHYDDRPDGMFVRYSIFEGDDGDRTLAEAMSGKRDGLSIGVDINEVTPDPLNQGVLLVAVGGAVWRETSVLALPAFDDARVTRVAAGVDKGDRMKKCATCGADLTEGVAHTCPTDPAPPENQPPTAPPLQLTNDQLTALLRVDGVINALAGVPAPGHQPEPERAAFGLTPDQISALVRIPAARNALLGLGAQAPEPRPVVDPTRRPRAEVGEEAMPYRFDRKGNLRAGPRYDFSTDIIAGLTKQDGEALSRAEKFVATTFATTTSDAAALNPNINRPDLYVDQKEFRYPIWDAIEKGTLADITPFVLPKFSSSSGLVAAHSEGVEPTVGAFSATSQTITPSAVSGKVSITREAWDQGGNPQLSSIVWRQMVRAWYEALEASAVTLLEGLTLAGALTITLTTGSSDDALGSELESYLAALQFVRGGFRMREAFGQVDLYKALTGATDADGRKLYPIIGPQNTSGQASTLFGSIDVAGTLWRPAWALAATGSVSANSYLFDADDVSGWATAPNRLTFENVEVRYVHLGIWGYKATACTDTSGVRRIAYDPVP